MTGTTGTTGSSGDLGLRQRPAWEALEKHAAGVRGLCLRQLFADDPGRGERLAVEAAGIYLDYSKNRVTDETLALLLRLAEESGLRERIAAMFRGDKINTTEGRAVLHVALRAPRGRSILVDGVDVVPEVHAVLDRMADFSRRVRGGSWTGHTGRIDSALISAAAVESAATFICGTNGFVETASTLVLEAGAEAWQIRTERFGPTG